MAKTRKGILATIIAFVAAMAVSATAWAANGTITINPPTGVDADATNTYEIYKIFDASGNGEGAISYKLCEGDELSQAMIDAGFSVDSAGNVHGPDASSLNADAIAAIADYVTSADKVGQAVSEGTAPAVSESLPNGYYYITTTTGTAVTITSTNPSATVDDKNSVPSLDKIITDASSYDENGKKALAQIGTSVEYTATIGVVANVKGYVFHDKMDDGLTYNEDVKVFVGDDEILATSGSKVYYTVGSVAPDTLTIEFADNYISTLNAGTEISIVYSATINSNALTADPEKNTAYLSYGDSNSNNKTPESTTETYNAEIALVKYDSNKTESTDDDTPLSGAGFVLAKEIDGETVYYKLEGTVVSWVDDINQATVRTSGEDGKLDAAFTGLADGTYKLVEKNVPAGFNRAEDSEIVIAGHDYTMSNLSKSVDVINYAGTALPSTGGIGTTIFYVVGGLLIVAAIIFFIVRARLSKEQKENER